MRITSYKYRQWKKKQNEKNLILRSERQWYKRCKRTAQHIHNKKLKAPAIYNVQSGKYEFHVPLNFSIIDNPEETSSFFNNIINFITNKMNFGKKIFIDISQVSNLTIDALMYLLAVVNNLNDNFNNRCRISGNAPEDQKVRKLFIESGFYDFVKHMNNIPLSKNNDTVQIMSGENCDNSLAKRLCDFVCEKANIDIKYCRFLYTMIIELMSNTHKHAYPEEKGILYPKWYCFAEYNKEDTVSFSFMDTGAGIPTTVRKSLVEKMAEKMNVLKPTEENRYIVSALDGDFRTATLQDNRGKGLPKIREFCSARKIINLHILANRADVKVFDFGYNSRDITTSLCGTLYYWQIDLSQLKGDAA